MAINFIICDLGGVYFTDGTTIGLREIKQIVKGKDNIIDELFRESPGKEGYLLRIGKLSSEEFWKIVSEKLDISGDKISKIREVWHGSYKPNKGMKELIKKLRKKYKVVAFSNIMKERADHLDKKYNFLKDFDVFVFSYEHGMTKRNPDFFKKMLEIIKANVEDCLFVDDKEDYLKVAKSLGMKTIMFKDMDSFLKDLRNFGICL
jgi:putative hydrolase of the HAD superfamily